MHLTGLQTMSNLTRVLFLSTYVHKRHLAQYSRLHIAHIRHRDTTRISLPRRLKINYISYKGQLCMNLRYPKTTGSHGNIKQTSICESLYSERDVCQWTYIGWKTSLCSSCSHHNNKANFIIWMSHVGYTPPFWIRLLYKSVIMIRPCNPPSACVGYEKLKYVLI